MDDGKTNQILSKQDYFQCSREQTLPNRCPILSRCTRRARTFELVRYREKGSYQLDAPHEPAVPLVGEDCYLVGGEDNFVMGGLCPEVALFDASRIFSGFAGAATTRCQYDKRMTPRDQILETGHFSECAEYVFDVYNRQTRVHPTEGSQQTSMTNTYNIGTVQGGAVSFGGDAQNNGEAENRIEYPEPVRRKIRSELDRIELTVSGAALDDSEKQAALARIADVRAEPSPNRVIDLVETLKAAGEIGTSVAPFLTAIGQAIGWT